MEKAHGFQVPNQQIQAEVCFTPAPGQVGLSGLPEPRDLRRERSAGWLHLGCLRLPSGLCGDRVLLHVWGAGLLAHVVSGAASLRLAFWRGPELLWSSRVTQLRDGIRDRPDPTWCSRGRLLYVAQDSTCSCLLGLLSGTHEEERQLRDGQSCRTRESRRSRTRRPLGREAAVWAMSPALEEEQTYC